ATRNQHFEHLKTYYRWNARWNKDVITWLDEIDTQMYQYNFTDEEKFNTVIECVDGQVRELVYQELRQLNNSYTQFCSFLVQQYGTSGFTLKRIDKFKKLLKMNHESLKDFCRKFKTELYRIERDAELEALAYPNTRIPSLTDEESIQVFIRSGLPEKVYEKIVQLYEAKTINTIDELMNTVQDEILKFENLQKHKSILK